MALSSAPAAGYDDLLIALALAGAGGARRVAVRIGNQPDLTPRGFMPHNSLSEIGCQTLGGKRIEDKRLLIRPEWGEALLSGGGVHPFHPAHL